jgi:predicted enzyme related to lactoylglutathione lyase
MQEVKQYPNGTFSWADLTTPDPEGAKTFYSRLFGWTADDLPLPGDGVYTMHSLHGKNVAGSSGQQPGMEGMPAFWNNYISVDDLEATTNRAVELGATLVAPSFDVMDSGRMSVIQDPTGAMISFWYPVNHIGASLVNQPNTLTWTELHTRDAETAKAFYEGLLGWKGHTDESGYTMFINADGRNCCGMVVMDENYPPEVPPHWVPYFGVENIEDSLAKIKELGGTVIAGPIPASETMSIGLAMDPSGASFNLTQAEFYDAPPGY